ncbi:uncharacterized protein [Halyomorpha halys]|uniref:uncharacterized protein n=1 Tax=Halyomorpha halys TaxID=286706 RepID=UPI0006D4F38B|nr:uncharacterized protein LOC106685038 [Halyomorpha halys]
MSNLFSVLAAIGVGVIIAGATFFFTRQANANHSYYDDESERKRQIKRCFKCKKDSSFCKLLTLVCGDNVHHECLYDLLVGTKVSKLKQFSCPSCGQLISYALIVIMLSSRCCVCKKEFDFDGSTCYLKCGHRLHKKCLEADKLKQQTYEKIRYKCPYSLLECNGETNFDDLPV